MPPCSTDLPPPIRRSYPNHSKNAFISLPEAFRSDDEPPPIQEQGTGARHDSLPDGRTGSRPGHMTRANVYIIFCSMVFLSEPSRSGGERTGVINRILFEIFPVNCVCFFKKLISTSSGCQTANILSIALLARCAISSGTVMRGLRSRSACRTCIRSVFFMFVQMASADNG